MCLNLIDCHRCARGSVFVFAVGVIDLHLHDVAREVEHANPDWDESNSVRKKVRLGVSICLDVVSIETLDLDTEKS